MNSEILLARQLLASGRIKEAISNIEKIVDKIENDNFFKNRLILISSQFNISDKEKKLSLSNDDTTINKSILNLLEILYDIEIEINTKNVSIENEDSKLNNENLTIVRVEPSIKDYKRLRIIYETNELFLQYFKGINKQIKRVIISDALDKNTIEDFTTSLETKLEELLILKSLIMDLEKQIRRKGNVLFIENDIFWGNKHIYKDAENLLDFTRKDMSLLEINYAIEEVKKTLSKLQNPVRNINGEIIGRFMGVLLIGGMLFWMFYNLYKTFSALSDM